jgi:outer membrane murein-binding lipoprotein Lpp
MKNVIRLFAVVIGVIVIASCGGQSGKEKIAKTETIEVSIDSLLVDASALDGKTVKFEAKVDHACMHGGKRLTVFGSVEGKTLKVEGSETTPTFETSLMGKKVEVIGIVRKVPGTKVADCETEEGNAVPEFAYTVECISVKEL